MGWSMLGMGLAGGSAAKLLKAPAPVTAAAATTAPATPDSTATLAGKGGVMGMAAKMIARKRAKAANGMGAALAKGGAQVGSIVAGTAEPKTLLGA